VFLNVQEVNILLHNFLKVSVFLVRLKDVKLVQVKEFVSRVHQGLLFKEMSVNVLMVF
jgi:hypothetical protein